MRAAAAWLILAALVLAAQTTAANSLAERNEELLRVLQRTHGLSDAQLAEVRAVFAKSDMIGQGNPAITVHPKTPDECRERRAAAGAPDSNPAFEAICGGRYMAPLYDPATQQPEQATACIDQFEFPDAPCVYPLVWVRAREAVELCQAMGKRLCDAHEWEGACAGSLQEPDYRYDLAAGVAPDTAVGRMAAAHNRAHSGSKQWSYGPAYRNGVCAAASHKSASCQGGGWRSCGSNTYPTGSFPGCRSPLGVYDLNGNAAEHMNLPLDRSQMASHGSRSYGRTEMKGSWFIFDRYRAHADWCRWRAPYWHGSRVMDARSHRNYHLGFRCCKTLPSK
jgi:formylglycine-generating enzyme required for sulfatase activity